MRTMAWLCAWIAVGFGSPLARGTIITGKVVDSEARPVEGAEVAVYAEYAVGPIDYDGRLIAPMVRTDSQGRFAFEVEVSNQRGTFIVARKEGLALAWDRFYGANNAISSRHICLVLEPPHVLAGRLVDAEGKAVANARVQALPVTSTSDLLRQSPVRAPQEWFTVTTDSQGRFRFERFAPDVSVTFHVACSGSPVVYNFRPHRLNAYGYEVWRSDIELTLPTGATINGRVLNERGEPVGGVALLIGPDLQNQEALPQYVPVTTQSRTDGTFVVENVPGASHRIDVVPARPGTDGWVGPSVTIASRPGRDTTRATVEVSRGGVLEITVLDAQTRRPLPGIKVNAVGPERTRHEPVPTDTSGLARLRVPAGSYLVDVSSDDFLPHRSTEEVVEGRTLRFQALLESRPQFTGRVLNAAGRPVPDIPVTINPMGDHVRTDRTGRFAGHWDDQFGSQGGFAVARDVENGLAAAVRVTNWSRPVDLRLSEAWTLTGKIVDPNGNGIPAAHLDLALDLRICMGDLGVKLLTDAQGRFQMKAIPPTPRGCGYRLFVNASGYAPVQYLSIYPSGSPGATVDVGSIQMTPANASVSGTVVDANGVPAAHASVSINIGVVGVDNAQPRKLTVANDRGEFTIRRICPGAIHLQATGATGSGSLRTTLPTDKVQIVLGQHIISTGETPLQNKRLPSLDDLPATLLPAELDGKPLLICFVDIQQRPCRQCLTELAQHAETLSAQGVQLLAVQVADVNLSRYETWLRQNDIAFEIHVADADFADKQSAWGIKGLPWLVLADKQHVVHAEGFQIGDLDAVLSEMR